MNTLKTLIPSTLLLLLLAIPARADLRSPRVVSQHTPDAYSMKTFAQHPAWKNLQADKKAWAIFSYLTDTNTGLYAMGGGPHEGKDNTYDFSLVRDPVKIINVYGTGYCDVFGPVMAGVWQDGGLGPARVVDLPDWSHVTAEVFYDNNWHYLDLDLRAAFRKQDGSLTSLEAARKDTSLWKGPNSPRFFPMDNLAEVQKIYAESKPRHRYNVHSSGHAMDYTLRRGETFTRWWKPQGGRWLHHSTFDKKESLKKILAAEPKGPKSKHASFTTHTHGNGRFVYQPLLTENSKDFTDGVYDSQNIKPGKVGLTLEKSGEGYAVFEVRSPYVIVPLVGDPAKTDDDKQASILELEGDGKGVSLSISRDSGAIWEPIKVKKWPAVVDLTKQVAGTYGYLLKIAFKGKPDTALLKSLKITTWVQLAPASLPALRTGTNTMQLKSGDDFGLETRVVEYRSDSSNETSFFKQMIMPPREYDSKHRSARVKGPFVLRVSAAPGTKIAWFSAGGSFNTHQQKGAKQTRNSMSYAVGAPVNFKEFYRAEVPTDVEHWHYNAAKDVRLETPAETIYLKYIGDPAVNNVRIYAHCIEDKPRPQVPVKVTHTWQQNGESKSFTKTLKQPESYEIDVKGDPVNESIEFSVPSSR